MKSRQFITGILEAGHIPRHMEVESAFDRRLVHAAIGLLRKIVREKGETITRFPELCKACIAWAQKFYNRDSPSNLTITLPTTQEDLQYDGAQDALLKVAKDLEELLD